MKQTFKQKYKELCSEVYEQLNHLVNTKGRKSEFKKGYSYSFWRLTLEQMCELVDSFK